MRLILTEGCIVDNFTIDGMDASNINIGILRGLCCRAVDTMYKEGIIELLIKLCRDLGNYSSSKEPCECCGDTIDTYELEL